jgi:post-segregation antitoxin (ccd killing protein)
MPKMQVYLPDDLYEQVKLRSDRLNVSGILQDALADHLAQMERDDALDAALAHYQKKFGRFTDAELAEQTTRDEREVVIPKAKRKRASAA